jgi:hypothetical protein
MMKCPACAKGLGIRALASATPGRPFSCRHCGAALKIDVKRAGWLAVTTILLCLVPLAGLLPGGLSVVWIVAVLVGAAYFYGSLAASYDPNAPLSVRAKGGAFELLADGVRYRGTLHSYADVLHLSRYARRTSINFIPVENYLRLRVHLKGEREPVTLQNRLGISTEGLQEIYERLAEKTFVARVRRYLGQLEKRGYFEFGGARFRPDGRIAFGTRELDLRTAKLSLEPFRLVVNPPGLFNRRRHVDAETDKDVLLSLMQKLYGITFNA